MQNAPSSILAVALVVLLLLIAFSSGTEVAMLSANRYKIRAAAKAGKRTAKVLDALLAKPDSWLGANLVVLALASVAASAIATLLAQRTGYKHAEIVTIIGLAIFMIVFCELAPKIYAALRPDPVALSSTYIYKVLVFVMAPVTWFTNKAAYGFLLIFGVKPVR
jgi:Mg2+/Co2+ transporter CorB